MQGGGWAGLRVWRLALILFVLAVDEIGAAPELRSTRRVALVWRGQSIEKPTF